jgi:AmiR/NasT family two-component response regulator
MLERAVRRVLLGDFGVIARMGLQRLLSDEGLDVLDAAGVPPGIIARLGEVQPDVVLLDLDAEEVPDLAARISSTFPSVTVIACSSAEPIMRVFPPFHDGESYIAPFTRVQFAAAVKT